MWSSFHACVIRDDTLWIQNFQSVVECIVLPSSFKDDHGQFMLLDLTWVFFVYHLLLPSNMCYIIGQAGCYKAAPSFYISKTFVHLTPAEHKQRDHHSFCDYFKQLILIFAICKLVSWIPIVCLPLTLEEFFFFLFALLKVFDLAHSNKKYFKEPTSKS